MGLDIFEGLMMWMRKTESGRDTAEEIKTCLSKNNVNRKYKIFNLVGMWSCESSSSSTIRRSML